MAAVQFQDVGSTEEASDIGKQITADFPVFDLDELDYIDDAPAIWIKTSDTASQYNKKLYYGYNSYLSLPIGWYIDGADAPTAEDLIALGRGFWIVVPKNTANYPKENYTVTFNGQVADMTTGISTPVCNNCFIMAGNTFPMPLAFSKIVPSSGIEALDLDELDYIDDAPAIWVKTSDIASQYNKKLYYGYNSYLSLPIGWYIDGADPATDADAIPVGNSFWIVIPDGFITSGNQETFTFNP